MQQSGSCPRGPFCAFAHVERTWAASLVFHRYLSYGEVLAKIDSVKYRAAKLELL